MRRKRLNQYGYYESILASLAFRFNTGGEASGVVATPDAPEPDIAPSNGGPDRDFDSMSAGTVEEPVGQPIAPGAAPAVTQARTPADPNQRAAITQTSQSTAAAEWQSIREAAQAQGFQFDGTVTDDRTALNFLLAQANRNRQSDVYAQLGQLLAPQAGQIQQYLQQQTQPQTAAPARQPWEAPEFDERWAGLVTRDEATGLFTANQGVPHEIAQKVNAYVEWKKGYDRNPAGVINGMVESRAKAIAQETFREQFAAQQRETTISGIVQENATWLYQVDQGGQRLKDYAGQFIPTPVGAAYLQQLQAVRSMGVTDPRQQDALAKNLVRGQYAQAYQAQALSAQNQGNNVQTQQAVTSTNINPLQAAPPLQRQKNPSATDPNEAGLSLAERMRRDMAAEGVTDADIFGSSGQ